MNHFSCFTGIGGIDLAAEWAGFQTVGQVEYADYPYQILCKHWPDVPKWRDIRDVNGDEIRSVCGDITVLSGGFPCQPHSCSGKRKASTDERDLWPELRRVIGEVRPKWFLGENVPGLLSSEAGRFFGGVLRDLAEMGYSVGWCSYEAARVGAWHRRMRTFIVAHNDEFRNGCGEHESQGMGWEEQAFFNAGSGCEILADSDKCDVQRNFSELSYSQGWSKQGERQARSCGSSFNDLPDTDQQHGNDGRHGTGQIPQLPAPRIPGSEYWSVEPGVGRVADGVPNRVDRLKCLGNAVVPEQIFPILQGIAQIESSA